VILLRRWYLAARISRYERRFTRYDLVLEMAFACEDHCYAVLISGGDGFIVFFRAARLDYCGNVGFSRVFLHYPRTGKSIRGHCRGKLPAKYTSEKNRYSYQIGLSGALYYLILYDGIIFNARDRHLPIAGQQLINLISRMDTDFFKHISKIHKRIMAIQFASGNKTVNYRCSPCSDLASGKSMIVLGQSYLCECRLTWLRRLIWS
jgi:hypothetical protein